MKIGIIGAGSIGKLYARLWGAQGHQIMLSARNADKAHDIASVIGVAAGSPAEAARFGDVVLLAVNYETLDGALDAIKDHVAGKLVIDATNPLRYGASGNLERMISEDQLAAEVMAARLPTARIAKTFTTLWSGHVEREASYVAPHVAMPFAVSVQEDGATVSSLIKDAGLVPVNLGPLAKSRPLDPPSPIWNVVLDPEELRIRIAA